jgi:hypothetical protein
LVIGGRGAGPIGYLRTATLTPLVDTIDTYTSLKSGGPVTAGNRSSVVRTIRQTRGGRWEIVDTWYDSTGRQTAWQYARTPPGSLRTELELVRATTDSASLLISNDHVTGWVVPARQTPRLFDSAGVGERYAGIVIASAIARTHPPTGSVFLAPTYNLYGASPIPVRVDSTRVVLRDTLYQGARAIPVVVLERAGGTQLWMDEATGAEIMSRGNAGPERYWWHIRRGVRPPEH